MSKFLPPIRCTRTLIPTEFTLVYITNPLDYHQPLCFRAAKEIDVNWLVRTVLYHMQEIEIAMMEPEDFARHGAYLPDEEQVFAGLLYRVLNACVQSYPNGKVWLSSAPHVYYNDQSGITIHSTYPDMDKMYPQTRVTLMEQGVEITTDYLNNLISKG